MKVRAVWGRVLRRVSLWLAQSEEDARRLVAMGARESAVKVGGNLKYDAEAPPKNKIAEQIRAWANGRRIIVAGSTCSGVDGRLIVDEEEYVFGACYDAVRVREEALLVVAPRHPERFGDAESKILTLWYRKASGGQAKNPDEEHAVEAVLLDTIGDLAGVYGIADVAFIGGSLVEKGGHNPLEPARFGVPVVIGPSFGNFRDVVGKMQVANGIRIVRDADELEIVISEMLRDPELARAMGERGRKVFEEQQGATGRAVEAIVAMIHTGAKP
jgi:3-deoxy-D-manno-octulosonic-acid transferase